MKFTSYSFTLIAATAITVALLGAASVSNVSAFVPAHLEYLTDAELEQAASTDRLLLVNPAVGKSIGFTESESESDDDDETETDDFSNTDDEEDNNDDSSDDASSELSSETEDIFDAASGGASSSETKATFLDFSNKPIVFSQFSSDTCDPSTELYSGEINSIKLIKFGEFCISDTIDLGDGDGDGETIISYTKLTNEDCSLFGVVDTFKDCTDEDCSECNDDDNYKSITTWDQIFPDPFAEHCFQTSYASDGESFDDTLNVDYQFALDSTENGLAYKKFIVINSCIQDFVSSEDVTFTSDSVTVTDEDGSSATITEDSLLLEDGDGASIEIDTEDGSITFEDESGNTLEVDDADVTITEDGSLVVVNDDILIVANDEGDFLAITEDSLTIGDDNAYITVTENAVTFGDSKEPSNFFTLEDVDVVVGDELEFITITFMDPDGSITFYDESVVFSNADGDFTVSDIEYSFTDGVFTIYGNTEEGELFGLGFNDEGAIFGIEDTFLAGFDSTTMTGFFINDDQAVFGELDDLVSDDDANDDDDDDGVEEGEEDDDDDTDADADDDADLVSDDDYLVNIISASFVDDGEDDGACLSICKYSYKNRVVYCVLCSQFDSIPSV
jgi:hypothetical protein